MNLENFQGERRRFLLLDALERRPGYSLDAVTLRQVLAAKGHDVSLDRLRTDLEWLDEQEFVIVQRLEPAWIATLTARGQDVRHGRITVAGVARPMPGE